MSSNDRFPNDSIDSPVVSLITTIRNEAKQLPELLASIEQQTLQPSEVIVVDGGSTDNTVAILNEWRDRLPLTVVVSPGANISTGRNIGIERACSPLIAVTDAGVKLEPDWLEQLIKPLLQDVIPVDVVGGFFIPDPANEFETALAATTLPDEREIEASNFLPSSRSVAFRKSWFDAGVRYPEWLDYCEDVVFDLRLKRAGAQFRFQPDAVVRFRPRRTVREFWRQYYLYARGDGRAGLFWKRHLVRYGTYLFLLPSAFLVRSWRWRLFVGFGALSYLRQPIQRLRSRRRTDSVSQLAKLTVQAGALRAIGDIAKMVGYPVGLCWRARRYGLRRDWRSIPE